MTPEGKVKAEIKNILKKHGVWYFMPRGTVLGSAGIPDFICCIAGKFVAIEAKSATGRLSAMQYRQIELIRNQGNGIVMVVCPESLDILDESLGELLHEREKTC